MWMACSPRLSLDELHFKSLKWTWENLICLIRLDVHSEHRGEEKRREGETEKPLIKLAKNRYQSYCQTFTLYFCRSAMKAATRRKINDCKYR